MQNKNRWDERSVTHRRTKIAAIALRVSGAVVLAALAIPIFAIADVLDEPFFGGALGRAAYSVPQEFIRHTSWQNELRFSFPPDTDTIVKNFITEEARRAYTVTQKIGNKAREFAFVSKTLFSYAVTHAEFPTLQFKAGMYASANTPADSLQVETTEKPPTVFEEAQPEKTPRCSRSQGFAEYSWCQMNTQEVF